MKLTDWEREILAMEHKELIDIPEHVEVEDIVDQENEEPFYWLTRYRLENPDVALPIGWFNLPDRYLGALAERLRSSVECEGHWIGFERDYCDGPCV